MSCCNGPKGLDAARMLMTKNQNGRLGVQVVQEEVVWASHDRSRAKTVFAAPRQEPPGV
jgi:hypothetical protein